MRSEVHREQGIAVNADQGETVVNGFVIQNYGWEMVFWLISAPFGLSMIMLWLYCPETVYLRDVDTTMDGDLGDPTKHSAQHIDNVDGDEKASLENGNTAPVVSKGVAKSKNPYRPAATWLGELKPWSGYVGDVSLIRVIIRPFTFVWSPIVLWGFMVRSSFCGGRGGDHLASR